jgi:hypothetical protein
MDERLAAMATKIKLDEFLGLSNSIIYNSESYNILTKLDTLFNEKFDNCLKFFDNMKKFTIDGKLSINREYYGKVIIEGNVIKEREKEFQANLKKYYSCSKKFDVLDKAYSTPNIILEKTSDLIFKNCVKENCESKFKKGDEKSVIENCIRDCLRYDLHNRYAIVRLENENNLKYINDLEKI